ncbi:MAG TPA: phage head morphogenesis protein [Phycisphaerales bacterium]|nr:MAG: hypothetical protein A2Y13_01185 [Planctomycetes bacterium GWC2_45_44]HBG77490.1 phage head morphogenesis protein [Phycisphaerales bacterium]HBR19098.1 phage head morphogenesis protein [Phycisphaerales bacterium]
MINRLPKTVNEIIADRAIRHALYLERYKTGQVEAIVKLLNSGLEPKLSAKLESSLQSITKKSPMLQKLFSYNGVLVKAEYKTMEQHLYKNLKDLAGNESDWQINSLNQSTPIMLDFAAPAPKVLTALVENAPMQGALLKDWFSKLADDTAFQVNRQISLGITSGEGIEQIVCRIKGTRAAQYSDGILNISRNNLRSIVRTSVSHVSDVARTETFKENSEVIKGVQLHATLDTQTCEQCMAEDGKIYEIDEAPAAPFHFSCRCTKIPVLKSWKELGINLKEAPEGTRASMNGQVPTSLTYGQWLKNQSAEIQNDALGIGKAKLFRDGKITVGDFVDNRGKTLTLNELARIAG